MPLHKHADPMLSSTWLMCTQIVPLWLEAASSVLRDSREQELIDTCHLPSPGALNFGDKRFSSCNLNQGQTVCPIQPPYSASMTEI